jgi:hypothetical protein
MTVALFVSYHFHYHYHYSETTRAIQVRGLAPAVPHVVGRRQPDDAAAAVPGLRDQDSCVPELRGGCVRGAGDEPLEEEAGPLLLRRVLEQRVDLPPGGGAADVRGDGSQRVLHFGFGAVLRHG